MPKQPRGYVRDLRLRRAHEEADIDYAVASVPFNNRVGLTMMSSSGRCCWSASAARASSPDTALATTPVGPAEAERLLRSLRHWPLLDGYRGRAKVDVAAIADAISRVSWLGADAGRTTAELDVNPLLVRSGDGLPVAVDARLSPG